MRRVTASIDSQDPTDDMTELLRSQGADGPEVLNRDISLFLNDLMSIFSSGG